MMITLSDDTQYYISSQPVDMRKSIDGLSLLVIEELHQSPQSDSLFIFYNRRKDKLKILLWHKNGFIVFYKRLERGRFKFPKQQANVYSINKQQLSWLIAGLEFSLMDEFKELNFEEYY